jgi:alkanesulfonate monooxygenase SsuD/methylene tetrahydromethanopterin reductase-like flavin-dependent oxidoreductase (luciferase family)
LFVSRWPPKPLLGNSRTGATRAARSCAHRFVAYLYRHRAHAPIAGDGMDIGLYTFGDVGADAAAGRQVGSAERLRNLVDSAPAVVLGAAAVRTRRIRLSSAVTVLSSDDPVRVFQQFATVDGLSGGRAEIMAGRGSFIESFPLFGYDLGDYDSLFDEKLKLLQQLQESERLRWPGGRHTSPINDRGVYPRPVQPRLPIWIAVGGTPQSAVRAGLLGLPMALAIIGGEPARFAPLFELYRQAARREGHDPAALKTSINVHGFVAVTSQEAADLFYPAQGWPPTSRMQFEAARGSRGALFVGSPAEVTDKILAAHEIFRFDRFLIQMAIGVLDHGTLLRAIELLGTQVAPALRKATAVERATA